MSSKLWHQNLWYVYSKHAYLLSMGDQSRVSKITNSMKVF